MKAVITPEGNWCGGKSIFCKFEVERIVYMIK